MTSKPDTAAFLQGLASRVEDILDACSRCGKCVEACPVTSPAGIGEQDPTAVVTGVLDILAGGKGAAAAETWARKCVLSGDCIEVCGDGVNPRFMLAMARLALNRADHKGSIRRDEGRKAFGAMSRGVKVLSRLQLPADLLARLAQTKETPPTPDEPPPEVVFYTGCNVLKTPHIALLALDMLDVLGVRYQVMGGPSHCCGILQFRAGDDAGAGTMGSRSAAKLAAAGAAEVLSWCPTCQVQFDEITLPTVERATGERPFELTPYMLYLDRRLAELRPHLKQRVERRIALHRHPGVAGVPDAAARILAAVPGVEMVDLGQPALGLMSNALGTLPEYRRALQRAELEAARAAGVDALAAVYHADHRELCAHEREWPFEIINVLEPVAESMGIRRDDHFKRLKMMQDADAILAECGPLLAAHGLNAETARDVVVSAMLAEQPLPLVGKISGRESRRYD